MTYPATTINRIAPIVGDRTLNPGPVGVAAAACVLGAAYFPWWERVPALKPISLVATLGVWPALAVNMALFAFIAVAAWVVESRWRRAVPGECQARARHVPGTNLLRGPWPLVAGALGLAAVNIATLALAGRPWGVTGAFALWGSKALEAAGVQMTSWPYWATPARTAELHASVFRDITSVM